MLSAHIMTVLKVMVRLDSGWIKHLEAVYKVVLGKVEAAGGRNDEETFVIQRNILTEAVQELLRVVIVGRDVQHGLFVLYRYL